MIFLYFDIHSHILPEVDDGATDIDNAVQLLEMAKENGISDILATPHFYPSEDSLEAFLTRTKNAYDKLNEKIENKELPNIYLGSEILYFIGMGTAENLFALTLNGTKYILLELGGSDINKFLFKDLAELKKRNYVPIIAHFERYIKLKGFKKLLSFVKANGIIVQINTISLTVPRNLRFLKKLLKNNIFCVLATDTHSLDERPPVLNSALDVIKQKLGNKYHDRLIKNSQKLFKKIIGEDIEEQKS